MKILYRLLDCGFKGYIVGGGVRDILIGKKPKDFDIATDATPRQMKSIFSNCRIIGRRFKLAHIFFRDQKIIEVATFRANNDVVAQGEGEALGDEDEAGDDMPQTLAHDNEYGTIETDALRRDLTINGLYYDVANFTIIDYVGGVPDLRNKLVRVIGDPTRRFIEDPVRMIRVLRHAVRAGFTVEPSCAAALREEHALIREVSTMRVFEELKKDFVSGFLRAILQKLGEHELLSHLLPDLTGPCADRLAAGSPLVAALDKVDELARAGTPASTAAIVTLLVLGMTDRLQVSESFDPYDGEDISNAPAHLVRSTLATLSVPRRERERVEEIIALWLDLGPAPYDEEKLAKFLRRRGAHDFATVLYCLGCTLIDEHVLAEARKAALEEEAEYRASAGSRPRRRGPRRRDGGGEDFDSDGAQRRRPHNTGARSNDYADRPRGRRR